ncbi:TPA: recombinase family protein [Escherichia coli]|mgnify:FL=1|uniref:Recombinase family protein n=4 Tax=Escherichia coli TaxID=562 RepID=A0AAV1IR20_ECOLX|nr:hypothetical protein [Salmonella enterica subsp. enterica serovar Ohio]EEW2109192.1 hypothetical protein [Escherichia coli]EDC6296231.1 recombinase family protein [Salmonella enterica subsp. enterica serovar Ohio]EEZ6870520.1 recombinase family protein [Escherichia coli]EFB2478492.1 recombinase family protein [Escherichia coli]
MSQKYLIRIAELESQLRQKDQQLSLVEETEAFLRSALARAEEKIEEDEREIEHLRAQIEKLRRMLFGTLVVPKLDRLARSVPDARGIADILQTRGAKLALGDSIYDPTDPMGKMFFNILATFAEFEGDLIRLRTKEGMAVARSKGKLKGKQPKLSEKQQKELCRMRDTGQYSISDLAELFTVSRATVYRTLSRGQK